MKPLLLFTFFFATLLGFTSLSAQTATDPNEGCRIEFYPGQNIWQFNWHGKDARTYFIQQSDDLIHWNYLPIVERGDGQTLSLGMQSNATSLFLRLNFPPFPVYNDDIDGDGLSDEEELLLGRDPFKADDSSSGLPDGWAVAYAGKLSVYPPQIHEILTSPQTHTTPIFVSNDTDQPVNFRINFAGAINETSGEYSATDSLTGQALYTWTDISTTGTNLNAISSADDASALIPLTQFSFPFFGQTQGAIYASSNGLLSFGSSDSSYLNQPILSAGNASPIIAGFWDDLDTNISGDVYYLEQADQLIVQYEQVAFHSVSGTVTFQIVLHSDGTIDLFYKEITANAQSASVGISNITGTGQGLQIAYNQPYIAGGLAVKIAPIPWVRPSLSSGTVSAHSVLRVDVLLDALYSRLAGLNNATLSITFDRSDTPIWQIPVTLESPITSLPVITLTAPVNARRLD